MKKAAAVLAVSVLVIICAVALVVFGIIPQWQSIMLAVAVILGFMIKVLVKGKTDEISRDAKFVARPGKMLIAGAVSGLLGAALFSFILIMGLREGQMDLPLILLMGAFILAFLALAVYLLIGHRRARIFYDENGIRYISSVGKVIECTWDELVQRTQSGVVTKKGTIKFDYTWDGYKSLDEYMKLKRPYLTRPR